MKKIYLLIFTFLILLPICVNAKNLEEYEYDKAFIKFNIDKEYWQESEFKTNPTLLDKKWTSNCGVIMTSVADVYNEMPDEYKKSLTREKTNYNNIFYDESEDLLNWVIDSFSENIDIDLTDSEYVNYDVKFIHFYGTVTKDDIEMFGEYYITFNNGYIFSIQYLSNRTDSLTCDYSVDDMAKSVVSTKAPKVSSYDELNPTNIVIDLLLTIVAYMIYPFFRIIIMKHKYTEKEVKKMILWNSIIVGGIFLILTSVANTMSGSSTLWSAGPAFLYYCINSAIWVPKFKEKKISKNNNTNLQDSDNNLAEKGKKKFKCSKCGEIFDEDFEVCPNCKFDFSNNDKNDEDNVNKDDLSICDNCGATVSENADKCSKCGCSFVEDEEDQEEKFVCDNCGSLVDLSAKKCPKCGEIFEDEKPKKKSNKKKQTNNKIESDMDQKYSDLNKLKKLLDKDIITKEEFEEEKKKILNK